MRIPLPAPALPVTSRFDKDTQSIKIKVSIAPLARIAIQNCGIRKRLSSDAVQSDKIEEDYWARKIPMQIVPFVPPALAAVLRKKRFYEQTFIAIQTSANGKSFRAKTDKLIIT
jgi:hypothetical protein